MNEPTEKKRSPWPFIIVGLLGLHFVASLIFVFLATSNPSSGVEEDYYRKALDWDDKRAQDLVNENLGWRVDVTLEASSVPGEPSLFGLVLHKSDGTPIVGAAVSLECFAIARSNTILRATAIGRGDGRYDATVDARRPGLWEIRLVAETGAGRFTHSERLTLTSP